MARSFVAASIGAMRLLTIALAGVLVACSATGVGPAGVDGTKTDQPSAAATEQPATTELPAPTPTPSATAMTSSIPRWDELPVAANDAVGLSQQLVMVETALHDPNVTGPELAWMGHLQQLAYSRLQDFPEWKDTVLAALPEQTRAAVNGSLEAGKQLRMLSGPVPKTLPDWKIVAPAPIDDLISYYKEAESEFGVSWYYLASIRRDPHGPNPRSVERRRPGPDAVHAGHVGHVRKGRHRQRSRRDPWRGAIPQSRGSAGEHAESALRVQPLPGLRERPDAVRGGHEGGPRGVSRVSRLAGVLPDQRRTCSSACRLGQGITQPGKTVVAPSPVQFESLKE